MYIYKYMYIYIYICIYTVTYLYIQKLSVTWNTVQTALLMIRLSIDITQSHTQHANLFIYRICAG